jgi:anti-sigma factor RsiW
MSACDRVQQQDLHLYLDNELSPAELLEVEKHLMECAACRAAYETLRSVVDVVRGAQPLYEAPAASFKKAQRIVERRQRARSRYAAAAAAAAAVVCFLALLLVSPSSAGEFREFAVDSHLRYARGAMPLDISSTDPDRVSRWLGARLPFRLQLPDYPLDGGTAKRYQLTGARLLQYANRDVAFLAYEMEHKPISLLMTSDPVAAPSGGTVYRSGALTFHFTDRKGLKLIAWTDRGIHYSLVSELGARGAESCIICHGRDDDRRVIEELRLGRK